MAFFIIWLGCAIVSAVIASSKGRSGGGWFILGAIFGIFALVAVAFMPAVAKPEPAAGTAKPEPSGQYPLRVCSQCNTYFPRELTRCPRCDHEV